MQFAMLTTLKIECIHEVFWKRHLVRWFTMKELNLHDPYEWGKDVYVKIKQDNKFAHQATKAK